MDEEIGGQQESVLSPASRFLAPCEVTAQTLECKAEAPLGFRFCAEKFTGGCVN